MKKFFTLFLITVLAANLLACGVYIPETTEEGRVYECDYKTLNLNTAISTMYNGEEITISGNIFWLLEDPLTVKDSRGNVIGYAGDAYGIIEQDDHGIYVGNNFEVNMCGNFEMFGNSYIIKDSQGNIVANAEFDAFNTSGKITDINDNLIAVYSSGIWFNDYTVTIYNNDICSDLAILMIMASYVSDYKADESD